MCFQFANLSRLTAVVVSLVDRHSTCLPLLLDLAEKMRSTWTRDRWEDEVDEMMKRLETRRRCWMNSRWERAWSWLWSKSDTST